jgi:hypothetical protein
MLERQPMVQSLIGSSLVDVEKSCETVEEIATKN